jgi:tetratricopeptide (TPR) repeat protein
MAVANHTESDEERIAQAREKVCQRPDDPEALRHLAGILYLAGRIEEAVPQLEKAVELAHGAVDYGLALADVYFDALRPKDAAKLYEGLLSEVEGPRRGRVQMNLELARSEVSFFDAIYEPFSKLDDTNPEKGLLEGSLALLQGRLSDAMRSYEKALASPATVRTAQENIAFLWSAGKEMPVEGRLVSHLLDARKGGEPSPRFLLYLADAYTASRLHEKARDVLIAALKANPKYLPAYDQAGTFLRQLNILGEGMGDAFRKAVNGIIDGLPQRIGVFAKRRFVGSKAAHNQAAATRAAKELLASSDESDRLNGLLEAVEVLTPSEVLSLIADKPPVKDPVVSLVLTRLRLRTAGLDRAIETILDTLKTYPLKAEVAYAASYFLGLRRRYVTAQRMVEAAENGEGVTPELLLEAGLVFVEAGEYDEALKLAEDKEGPEAMVVKARARMRSGREEEAVAELEHAWEETGSDIVKRELAAAYFRVGRDEDAIDLLSK